MSSGRTPTVIFRPALSATAAVSRGIGMVAPPKCSVPPSASTSSEVHRRRADEAGDEDVGRVVVHVPRGVDLLEDAVLEHRDPVAHRHGLDLVVGDVDRRDAEPALQRGDLGAGLHAQLRVEVRQRLVHEEHLRLAHDRPAHRDALALAAGERLRLAVEVLLEVEDLRRLADPLGDLVLGLAGDLQREAHVLADRHVRVERVVLEHHRDVAVLGGQVRDVALADADRAAVDVLEPGEHPQRGRLAAAGGADEDEELAVADLDVELVDGGPLRAREEPGGLVEGHSCHERTSFHRQVRAGRSEWRVVVTQGDRNAVTPSCPWRGPATPRDPIVTASPVAGTLRKRLHRVDPGTRAGRVLRPDRFVVREREQCAWDQRMHAAVRPRSPSSWVRAWCSLPAAAAAAAAAARRPAARHRA